MSFTLPNLPYARDALEPYMSSQTLDYHYAKHHQGYVTKLNALIKGTPLETAKIEDIILESRQKPDMAAIFNNAGQFLNHIYFWNCMKPGGGGHPEGRIAEQISKDFGRYDDFRKAFIDAGVSVFGSGWVWLVWNGAELEVMKTSNADLPLAHGKATILACDVWEHAYYLDYQNRRPDFLEAYLDKLINWDFATENLMSAL